MTIHFEQVTKRFEATDVVKNITFEMASGECLALVGPSGAGKSTVLRLISGLERVDGGEIYLDGELVSSLQRHIRTQERHIAMVFQDQALWSHLAISRHFKLITGGRSDGSEYLNRLGLRGLENRRPDQLSGGEAQKLCVALAVAAESRLLLLDEPRSHLDMQSITVLDEILDEYRKQSKCTTVIVSHDPKESARWADRVAFLDCGQIHQIGRYEDLYREPATAAVARQMGPVALIDGVMCASNRARTPLGELPVSEVAAARGSVVLACRPEDWLVDKDGSVRGEVRAAWYVGGKWIAELTCATSRFVAYIPGQCNPGDTMSFRLQQPGWPINLE